jgi:hypothetical protein
MMWQMTGTEQLATPPAMTAFAGREVGGTE